MLGAKYEMMKKYSVAFALLFVLSACAQTSSLKLDNVKDIRESCRELGAYKTIRLMDENGSDALDNFYRHIAAGDEAWLQLVPMLAGGSSGVHSARMAKALAEAMPLNPEGVLALESSMVSMKLVCSMPFKNIDAEGAEDYYLRTLAALDTVDEVYFEQDKKICLARLDDARQKMKRERSGEYIFD